MARRATLQPVPDQPKQAKPTPSVMRGYGTIKALKGSGEIVGRPGDAKVPPPSHASKMWQLDAWNYADAVGELKFVQFWFGNCGSRIRLVPGLVDEYGAVQTSFDDAETEPPPELDEAAEYIAELRDKLGGQPELMRAGFENFFVAGECFLLGTDGLTGEQWEIVSVDELRPVGQGTKTQAQKYLRLFGPGLQPEPVPEGAFVARLWRPHRRFKRLADSSVHGALEVLQELVLLTHGVRASTISRLRGAGLLFISTIITQAMAGADAAEEGSEEDSPFVRDLIEAMTNPIEDPASASRVVPMVVEADVEDFSKLVQYLNFGEQDRVQQVVERREALERLSMMLDAPPEVMMGHAQTTFANAVQIDDDSFRAHLEPTAVLLTAGLTDTYLHARFRAAHGIKDDEPLPEPFNRIAIGYDASRLVSKPNRSKEVISISTIDPTVISNAAKRRALGFEEADAPDEAEVEQILHVAQQVHTHGTIRIAENDPALSVAVDRTLLSDPDGNLRTPAVDAAATDTTPTPPTPPPPPSAEDSLAAALTAFSLRAGAACEFAVDRAADRAAGWLYRRTKGSLRASLDSVPREAVARTIGPAAVTRLSGDDDPFCGEFAELCACIARWAADTGLPHPGDVAARVTQLAEAAARARLFDGASTVTAADVRQAVMS